MAFSYPLDNPRITQYFGANPQALIQPWGHYGVDFGCALNTPIKSIGAGTVVWASRSKNMGANPWMMIPFSDNSGEVILVDHGELVSVYAHLNGYAVKQGDTVVAGQTIGYAGNTGYSFGVHLHLELILERNVNGYMYGRVNPLSNITQLAPILTLAKNQRKVGPANLNQRDQPLQKANTLRTVPANTVETFLGYAKGEPVTVGAVTSDVWFKDKQGYVWAGGFSSQSIDGLPDLSTAPIKPNQRKVLVSGATQRDLPARKGKILRAVQPFTIEEFSGYVHGEEVTSGGYTSDIWYKDSIGYIWSGGFTVKNTVGLLNETPKPVGTRKSGNAAVAYRVLPFLGAKIDRFLPANTEFIFDAYTHGDSYGGSDVWFRGRENKFWVHSALFTSQSTEGLLQVVTEKPVEPVINPPYAFKPDFDFVEYLPASTWNMQDGNFPLTPKKVVLHQFDAKEKKPSVAGVINHFQTDRRPDVSSAHFVVSGTRIIQMVSLRDRAYHAGPVGNDYIGIEVDPQEDVQTVASVKKLLAAIKGKYGYLPEFTEHRDVPETATSCGVDIHLYKYELEQEVVVEPVRPVEPTAPKVPSAQEIVEVLDYLKATVK